MLGIIKYIKFLPIVVVVATVAIGYHKFAIGRLEDQVTERDERIEQQDGQILAYQTAEAQNLNIIESLETELSNQARRISGLNTEIIQLEDEKDEYLNIFRRHDLNRLALARPGLIEPRINNGTNEVFTQLEEDSKEIADLNNLVDDE